MIGSICFEHNYAHHQQLITIVLIAIWAVRLLGCVRVVFGLCPGCVRVQVIARRAVTCNQDTYPTCLHLTSNQQPKNRTAHVVISTRVVSS